MNTGCPRIRLHGTRLGRQVPSLVESHDSDPHTLGGVAVTNAAAEGTSRLAGCHFGKLRPSQCNRNQATRHIPSESTFIAICRRAKNGLGLFGIAAQGWIRMPANTSAIDCKHVIRRLTPLLCNGYAIGGCAQISC